MAYGKTIELFLVNGTADSLVTAELSNWNGKAIKVPRTEIAEYDREDLKNPGIYFLFGEDDDANDSVYVGEAENLLDRLNQHRLNEKENFHWNTVVAFTGRDLNKAHIRYLENRIVNIARECNRYKMITKNTYSNTVLKESQIASMEEFIDNVKIVINALGYKVLDSVPKATENTIYLYCNDAKGYVSGGGFTVCLGSKISDKTAPSMERHVKHYYRLRNKLILNEIIKDGVFQNDYEFRSPSAAAAVILGSSSNGKIVWKSKDGTLLKDLGI